MTQKQKTIWEATQTGKYPEGTTTIDLINCNGYKGYTALHRAAYYGYLLTNTSLADLIGCKDSHGICPLHSAMTRGHIDKLPPKTTPDDLASCLSAKGKSAWECFLQSATDKPNQTFQVPPEFFKNHHQMAIEYAETILEAYPAHAARATIWLAKVFAPNEPNTKPTPLTELK